MNDTDRREKKNRDRIRCLLLLWTLEAGVIARTTLRERALEELEYRWETLSQSERTAFNNHLSRDLHALMTSNLIEAIHIQPDGSVAPYGGHDEQRMRNQVYFRATLSTDFVVLSPDGPVPDTDGTRAVARYSSVNTPTQPSPRGRADLMFALAELQASSGRGGLGDALLKRILTALEARFGRGLRTPRIRHRPLPPSLGEDGRHKIKPHVWDGLVRAMDRGLRIQIRFNRRKSPEDQRLCPYRIVWYNGRPRLEAYWYHLGVRRWRAIPLHHLAHLEALEQDRIEWAGDPPSEEERMLLDNVWGADLEDPTFLERDDTDRRPLAALASDVELLFRGSAASAVRGDPGCKLATLSLEHDAEGQLVRYRVRTLVGIHFKKWLASWGPEVQVVKPTSLAAEMAETARRVYLAHQEAWAAAAEEASAEA